MLKTGGLLYSPPVSTHISTPHTGVKNSTVSTGFNTFNGNTEISESDTVDEVTESTETLPTVTEEGGSIGNSTFPTPSNASNGKPDIPDGIAPSEYQECYNTAYSVFTNKGLPPDQADRQAREEIRRFVAGYNPPGSGAAVSPPPLTTLNEEIDF
jgi:hypothetical protein